jgi:nucleoside 2-deoxyribosyltransferase
MKIYIAGPDVFLFNAKEHFDSIKNLVSSYGHIALVPLDNEIIEGDISDIIFEKNIKLIDECDVILTNIEPFRGACIDDGTAFEVGYGFANKKIIYGYSLLSSDTVIDHTKKMFDITKQPEYTVVEDFGHTVNLMLQHSIYKSGGKILNTLEECLINLGKNL